MKSENTTMRKRQLAAFFCALSCAFAASATNWYVSPDGTGGGTSPTLRRQDGGSPYDYFSMTSARASRRSAT